MTRSATHSLSLPEKTEREAKERAEDYMRERGYDTTIMPWAPEHVPLDSIPYPSDYESHSVSSRPRTPSLQKESPPEEKESSLKEEENPMDKTVELMTKILSGSAHPDVTALSETIKARLGITMPLEKPVASPSPGIKNLVTTLTGDQSAQRLPEVGACPSPFHPRIRTLPVSTLAETPDTELAKLGLTSLAPSARAGPEPPSTSSGGRKAIAQANISLELTEFDPKILPEWAEEFSEFLLLTGQTHADVETKCSLIRKSCKKKYLQRQVKLAIKKCTTWGEV